MIDNMLSRAAVVTFGLLVFQCCAAKTSGECGAKPVAATGEDQISKDPVCTRGEFEPVLNEKAYTNYAFEVNDDAQAREQAELPGGTRIVITHAGCTHYILAFAFTLENTGLEKKSPQQWLTYASRVFGIFTALAKNHELMGTLQVALNARAADGYSFGETFAISEMEQASLTVEASGREAILRVVYDVTL